MQRQIPFATLSTPEETACWERLNDSQRRQIQEYQNLLHEGDVQKLALFFQSNQINFHPSCFRLGLNWLELTPEERDFYHYSLTLIFPTSFPLCPGFNRKTDWKDFLRTSSQSFESRYPGFDFKQLRLKNKKTATYADYFSTDQLLRYLLMTCQLDTAIALTRYPDQNDNLIREINELDALLQSQNPPFCKCKSSHTELLKAKIAALPALDDQIKNAVSIGNEEEVEALLARGASPLVAFIAATLTSRTSIADQITMTYHNTSYSPPFFLRAIETLTKSEDEESFIIFYNHIGSRRSFFKEFHKTIIETAIENHFAKAVFSIMKQFIQRQVMHEYSNKHIPRDAVGNICYKFAALDQITFLNEDFYFPDLSWLNNRLISLQVVHLFPLVTGWLEKIKFIYARIEQLILEDKLEEFVETMTNSLIFDPYFGMEIAMKHGRMRIITALLNHPIPDQDFSMRFDFYQFSLTRAAHYGNLDLVIYLAKDLKIGYLEVIECLAATGNKTLLLKYYNPVNVLNDALTPEEEEEEESSEFFLAPLEWMCRHNWEDLIITLSEMITNNEKYHSLKTIVIEKFLGLVASDPIDVRFRLLSSRLIDIFKITALDPEDFYYWDILSNDSRVDVVAQIKDDVLRETLITEIVAKWNPTTFRAEIDKTVKLMQQYECDSIEARALNSLSIRTWFLQGMHANAQGITLPRDIFLLISSKLIGKEASSLPDKFRIKIYQAFLNQFLNRQLGRNQWVKINDPTGKTVFQQEGHPVKRARSDSPLIPLTVHENRLGIQGMFYRPAQRIEDDAVTLNHRK